MCPLFSRLTNTNAVLNFIYDRAIIIGDVDSRHCLREMPQTMAAAKVKVAVRGWGGKFSQIRKQVGFALQRESHNTWCAHKIFQRNKPVFKHARGFVIKVTHHSPIFSKDDFNAGYSSR